MSEHEPKPVAYIRDFGMRSLSEGTHTTVMPEVFLQYDIPLYPASVVTALQEEVTRLRAALADERKRALEEAAKALDAWGDIYGDNAAKTVRALKEPTK